MSALLARLQRDRAIIEALTAKMTDAVAAPYFEDIDACVEEFEALTAPKPTSHVRVGADFDSKTTGAEVTRVDFDTAAGVMCVVVQRLGSIPSVVVDIFPQVNPIDSIRVGNFPTAPGMTDLMVTPESIDAYTEKRRTVFAPRKPDGCTVCHRPLHGYHGPLCRYCDPDAACE